MIKKKISIGLSISVCLAFISSTQALFAQDQPKNLYDVMYDPTASFSEIQKSARELIQADPEVLNRPGSGYKHFSRWSTFWQDRVYNGNTRTQSFSNYGKAVQKLLSDVVAKTIPFCTNSSLTQAWQPLGPTSLPTQNLGIVVSLAVDPTDNTILYAGTNASGLWQTNNNGLSWTNLTDNSTLPVFGVQSILIDPNNPSTIYIAASNTGYGRAYGYGVLKTVDGGSTWIQAGPSMDADDGKVVQKILMDPTNSSRIYALVQENSGNDKVYRTTDGGTTWTEIFNGLSTAFPYSKRHLKDIEMKPGDPNTLYISSTGITAYDAAQTKYTALCWKTSNATSASPTWAQLNLNIPDNYTERIDIAVTPSESGSVWIGYTAKVSGNSNYLIDKSTDNGQNWSNIFTFDYCDGCYCGADFQGTGYWRNSLVISPTDPNVMYVGGYEVDKIVFNGGTYTTTAFSFGSCTSNDKLHVDQRDAIFVQGSTPGTSGATDLLYFGNDGGVTKIVNGNTFSNINGDGSFAITQFYGIATTDMDPNIIVGGSQDNGVLRKNSSGWNCVIVGDAYRALVDYTNPSIMYVTSNGGSQGIDKSTNGGTGWFGLSAPPSFEPARNDKPFLMHPTVPSTLYAGYHDIYRSTNSGGTWSKISNFTANNAVDGGQPISAIGQSRSNPSIMYASFEGPTWDGNNPPSKKLFKTTDGGTTWTDISSGCSPLQWAGITDIAVHPTDPNKLWVTFGGFWENAGVTINKVYASSDGGVTWQDYTTGLPNFPVNSIMYLRGSNDILFVGTDVGVYYRERGDLQWYCFNNGLPIAIISDLEVNYTSRKLIASTYGRGVWNINLSQTFGSDLYSKDSPADQGVEPNTGSDLIYLSKDMWNRRQPDGIANQTTQNPEYRDTTIAKNPNYLYVKVRNRGQMASSGLDSLKVYWAKASTGLSWPQPWNGSSNQVGLPPFGGVIGKKPISVLNSGDSSIYMFEWYPANPSWYASVTTNGVNVEPWHFCLLSRIENSPTYPHGMKCPETASLGTNVSCNNNIIWKNVTVIDSMPGAQLPPFDPTKGCFLVENLQESSVTIKLGLSIPVAEQNNSILKNASINLELSPALIQKWVLGGMVGNQVQLLTNTTVALLGKNAWIGNITLAPNEKHLTCATIRQLVPTLPKVPTLFNFDIIQSTASNNELIGGEHFEVTLRPLKSKLGLLRKSSSESIIVKQLQGEELSIYPNPTEHELIITATNGNVEKYVYLFDLNGKEVFKGILKEDLLINVSTLAKGSYILKIIGGTEVITEKIVVQ